MADGNNGGSGLGLLGVLVGAAIVAGLGYFFIVNGGIGGSKTVDVNIKPPAASAPASK